MMKGKNMENRKRSRLVLLDRLTRTMKDDRVSKWQGDMGWWVIEVMEKRAAGKPIARLYLNRKFLSGVFTTKNPKEYSADMLEVDRRRYLVLRSTGPEALEVWERLPVEDSQARGRSAPRIAPDALSGPQPLLG